MSMIWYIDTGKEGAKLFADNIIIYLKIQRESAEYTLEHKKV